MRKELYHRELHWMEQFSMALHVFSGSFGAILKVLLFIFLPISLLEGIILERMTQTTNHMLHVDMSVAPTAEQMQQIMETFMQMMTQEFLLYAVTLFLQPVGIIAIAKMVKQYIDGEKIETGKAIGEALNHMPAIIITGFLYGALVLLGSFVIVPGIYFGIAWGLYYFCIAFEGKKGWEALRGSKVLIQGKWLRTFGYMFFLSFVAILWNSVFQLICSFFGDNMAADMIYQFLCYVSVSFVAVGECLLYLNRKAMAERAYAFENGFAGDAAEADMPAEFVEGVVEGTAEEKEDSVEVLEEKKEEKNGQ